jgi:hypothetical protein
MINTPSTVIAAPHAVVGLKSPELDLDRTTPLTPEVAAGFVAAMNVRLSKPNIAHILNPARAEIFAGIINHEMGFPVVATLEGGQLILSTDLQKNGVEQQPVVKDLSDGVTEICKQLASFTELGESKKFMLAMLFQPALYQAYHAAGLTEGAHTKYVTRSC